MNKNSTVTRKQKMKNGWESFSLDFILLKKFMEKVTL